MSEVDLMAKALDVQDAAKKAAVMEMKRFAGNSSETAAKIPETDDIGSGNIDTDVFPPEFIDTAMIESIPDKFSWMIARNYSSLDTTRANLSKVREDMSLFPDKQMTENGGKLYSNWLNGNFEGVTADEFGGYLGKVADAFDVQVRACEELRKAAALVRHLANGTEDHLDEACDKAINELGAISLEGGGSASSLLFWVLGAALTVGTAAVTSGGSLAVKFALADVALGSAQDMFEGEARQPESPIEGYRVNDILTGLFSVISELKETLSEREKDVAANLKNDHAFLTGAAKDVISPEPLKAWT